VQEFTVEEVIEAWKSRFDDDSESEYSFLNESHSLTSLLLSLLAEGRPVSATQLAERSGLSLNQVETAFRKFKGAGGEFDDEGNLVGAALTLNPTPHRFRLNGKQLFTWCSLDALFLPGLLEQTAEVESNCPVTGVPIKLTIAPDGIVVASPEQAVLSITIPGVSCETGDSCAPNKTGPESDAGSQMHFFSSRAAAEVWLKDHPGVVILTTDQAYRLARENWIDRLRVNEAPASAKYSVTSPTRNKSGKTAQRTVTVCRC
jgi:alkylmercury lyase